MMVGNTYAAIRGTLPWTSTFSEFTLDHPECQWALPPDIGPSVAWIMQHGTNKRLRRHVPHEPGDVALTLVDGQFQASASEPEKGLADTAPVTNDPKDVLDGWLQP